jgi:hypothetical protein
MSLFFVDTQTGRKVRLKGTAKLYLSSNENPNTCVHLRVSYVWENCPRFNCFIDRDAVSKSPVETFYFPLWKRLDIVQAALTPKERLLAMQLGLISAKQWDALITEGGADLEYKY